MKTLTEQRIERMWYLEHGTTCECIEILKYLYIKEQWSIKKIADYYVQSYGSIQELLKKYNIEKEIILIWLKLKRR